MNNTKLIKKLKSLNFVTNSAYSYFLELQIEEYGGFVRYTIKSNTLLFFKHNAFSNIQLTTSNLKEILNKIKEVTGVTLKPKSTKNKRIKDLAKLTHALTKEIVELRDGQDELRDVIVELQEEKHRIWERLAVLEGRRAQQQSERVRILKAKSSGVDWSINEIAKVVVRSGDKILLQKENYDRKDWFNIDEVTEQLSIYPVESDVLEFGSHAIIIGMTHEGEDYTFSNGDVVRVGVKDGKEGNYICDNQNGCAWVKPENLKPKL